MARTRIVLSGMLIAVAATVMLTLLAAWLSWRFSLQTERHQLRVAASHVIERTQFSIAQATSTLKALTPLSVAPCSEPHIHLMRQLAMNTNAIDEIGYVENRALKCSSWGGVDVHIEQAHTDFVMPGGVEVTQKMTPVFTGGDPVLALRLGPHDALINGGRFVAVTAGDDVHLALAGPDRKIVAESGSQGHEVVAALLAGGEKPARHGYLYAVVHDRYWTAVAVKPRPGFVPYLRQAWLWMLPVGVVIGVIVALLTVRVALRRLSPVAELRAAVKNREFVVHYQPIIELRTGRCTGAEALVRWRRPDGTMISPDRFIPLAEESGLIRPITDQLVDAVIREMKTALVADRSLHIGINLCAGDILSGRALSVIDARLAGSGIHASQIWLEATEREFMDVDAAHATLAAARAHGYRTAIDDFGTGYSSLQYLQSLPIDVLKIDRSFVGSIGKDAVSSPVVAHIIEIAKSLNFAIVAEGVETQEQADYLAERGVEFAQGWLYSKALPAADFLRFREHQQAAEHGPQATTGMRETLPDR